MESEKEVFRKYLRGKGLRLTAERKEILQEIFSTHEHFDVEDLYDRLKQKSMNISRSTIYRAIPLLLDSGLIIEAMRCREHIYYEHIYGHKHHFHLVCIKCGKIIEFKDEVIKKEKEKICNKYNFKPTEYRFGIKGYCEDCQ
jgi:Fur family ferric uptake transcriptional regulator